MRCDSDSADEAREMINTPLGNGTLIHGWKGVKMIAMNLDMNATAMYVQWMMDIEFSEGREEKWSKKIERVIKN